MVEQEKELKLTVVTPTYNQADTLAETLQSVLDQDLGPRLQYIVVDGLSTDSTPDVIERYTPRFREQGVDFSYVREADDGQSDAINKGWALATGTILGYLNSDDYFTPRALQRVLDYFASHGDMDWAYGGWQLVGRHGQVYMTKQPTHFSRGQFLNYCDVGQPSCFFRRHLLDEVGFLDISYHLAMDYHLWVRFADLSGAGIIPDVLSCMRYYGGAKSAAFARDQALEVYRIAATRTSPWSFRRMAQRFYLLRALCVVALRMDITRRVERGASGSSRGHHEA
jgi:glycosyltransferase involved in cell wall biosynthesis